MAFSKIDIINNGLIKIGDYIITDVDDGTKQATYASKCWNMIRDTLLREYNWNFATRRVELSLAAGVSPVWNYDNYYGLPTDYLKDHCIAAGTSATFDWSDTYEYKIETYSGATVYLTTNEDPPMYLKYTAQITGTSTWTPSFCEIMSCRVAKYTGTALAALSQADRQMLIEDEAEAIAKAKGIEFEEGTDDPIGYYEMTYCRDN